LTRQDLYRVIPALEGETGEVPEDTVYSLSLSPALNGGRYGGGGPDAGVGLVVQVPDFPLLDLL
ncbi:MAG: hypothetical protein LBF74_14710, partial [Treponema sp.]|nr:hypothetical protein [Treponema sp.]